MSVTSVLVAGAGLRGCIAAAAFARRGLEVALVDRGRGWPVDHDAARAVRELAVDVRLDLTLVGAVDVDSHVEAELSNNRVENYDAIVIADDETADLIVADRASRRVFVFRDGEDAEQLAERVTRSGGHPVG